MSCRRLLIATIFAAILSGLAPVAADPLPSARIDPVDLKNIILLKDIKPGMTGYGKTVFRGTKPETFQVRVLGVLKKNYFGSDLILVKLTGGPMTSRGATLIEGMSGSPIYINGKIAGAFAFGYPFGKEPIGMVQPIEYMLDAWDPTLPSKPSSFYPLSAMSLDHPIALDGKTYTKVTIDCGIPGGESGDDSNTLMFRPLATPLMVSGMSPRIMAWLTENLKPLNIRPVAGPGLAADKGNLAVDVQPGSSVGVSFVTGDVDMTGIGTVTYRRGDRILAFGHPMFTNPMMNGLGAINAPLTTTYVYEIFPSIQVSSKIAAPIKPIGCAFQDRPWAIAARLGDAPTDMIPLTVRVNDQARKRTRDFRAKVINNPMLAPVFIVAATGEAIFEMRGNPGDVTANVKLEVVADEVGTIKRENTFFDPVAIDTASLGELNQILMMLQFNPFYPVGVKSVTVNVDLTPKHQTAKLDRIFLKEGKFKPGDTIEVGAVLKPFKGEKLTKTIKLELPKNTPNGRLTIEVFGGTVSRGLPPPEEQGSGVGPSITSSSLASPSIENLQQMIKKFLERNRNNELVARIVLPKSVPSIGGEKFIGLPPSISDAMKSSKNSMQGLERDEIKVVTPMDWVIFGSQRLTITVQRADKAEKKTAAKKTSESSTSESGAESAPPDETSGDESGSEPAMLEPFSAGWQAESLVTPPAPVAVPDAKPAEIQPAKPGESSATEETPARRTQSGKDTTTGTNEKPVGRAAAIWKQTTRTDFLGGTFKNTTATTGDLLTLAGSLKPLCDSGEIYVWCIQPDGKGGIYAGTGNLGVIYKIATDGTLSVLYDSPELEVLSLEMDSAGNVYAGTAPNGIVYKIAPDGKASVLFDADEKYITALALDRKGNLYAATGDKCKVYKICSDKKAEIVLDSSEYNALSLAADKDDNVYVGTGQNGIIYKITPNGAASVLYDAAEEAVTALGVDSQGSLYAGTSPKGVIYKLTPDATPKAIYDKADKAILGICADDLGNVYAVNAVNVFKITPDDKVCTLGNEPDLQFLSIAIGDGQLYAGTGNVGSVYTAEIGKAIEGTYESPVHDCGLPSRWGTISWTADMVDGTSTVVQTRTGNDAEPDSTWSDWCGPYGTSGATVISPPGRYIQYRVTLKTNSPAASPKLRDISIVYLPRNQAPKLTLTDPKGGERWSGKKTIKWTATDPDKDTLSYEVFYSGDSGATWKPLGDKVQKPTPEKPKTETKPAPEEAAPAEEATQVDANDAEQMLADIAAELDKHPEIPQEVKDQILEESAAGAGSQQNSTDASTSSESAKSAEPDKKPTGNGTKQTSFSWDTAKAKDGSYLIKIVGSDRLSNPVDAMTGEAVSEAVVVCNKAPRVIAFKKTITVQADKSVRFDGFATQETVGIAGAQYRIGTDDWASAAAADGIFDSSFESFTVTTQPLTKGSYTIEVKAIDQAGNSATTKVSAKVE